MEIKEAQDKIKEFDVARGWDGMWTIKDLLLNITEEGGELWNLIKWIDEDKQREVIAENRDEAADYVGDTLFLVLKLANRMGVDAEAALNQTLSDYEKRMPADIMKKVKCANKLAGGHDDKGALDGD
jgi:NTP pyrophosphatase (non-canonical NTP hydrolase)